MLYSSILIVDDDTDDRMLMKEAFDQIDYKAVAFFQDGHSLLAYLDGLTDATQMPRLIVSDLNMPRMDGKALLQKVKQQNRYKDIAIIIFSTADKKEYVEECLRLGAKYFFVKPRFYHEITAYAQTFMQMIL